ncbi:MAG TPA: NAD(P)/FAD-dependent oxidoreductase [Trebonia sp.]|nr:NAD(P)/FAD-dependent oxidoreductase [Trebonia sp.]
MAEARVVIIGAGFAGLNAVTGLRKTGVRVTVIDKNLYSTFQPLLYQVATGGLNPGDVAYPVGGVTTRRNARYIRGELATIDQGARTVRLVGGREVGYDYLVLATGMAANYFGIEGAEEHTFGLYTRADAIVLRDHIMNGFEWLSADPDGRRDFAVTMVGGGATGVELAGTLGELRSTVLRSTFPDVDPERMQIRLVEMAPQLLMPFHPKLREYTRRQLVARGVDIRLNTEIRQVTEDCVVLADGTTLRSDLTVWTAGVAAHKSVTEWGLPQGKNGRLLVQPDLRVQGSERIFAAGDMALDSTTPSPQLAQPAIQEGRHAAAQIVRLLNGEQTEPFHYHDKGTMATIGRRSAVVELPRGSFELPRDVRFTGTLAWLSWLGLHLIYLLGNRNRVATLINLTWRYIAWGHGGGVIVGDEPTEPLPGEVGDDARHSQQEKRSKRGPAASRSAG